MAYPGTEEIYCAKLEATFNADSIAGTPSDTDFLKVYEPRWEAPIGGIVDAGAVGPYEPGFATLPGERSYSFQGRVELPGLTVVDANSTPRGWQVLQSCGLKATYAAGPPKTQTIIYDPAENKSLTVYRYQRQRPATGSASHQLDVFTGARGRATLLHREGRWWVEFALRACSGAFSEGVSLPAAAPYLDGNSAHAVGLTWAKTSIATFQDSAAGNVFTTGIVDLSHNLGGDLQDIRTAGNSGNPVDIVRLQGRRTGTLRIYDPGRAVWNGRTIQGTPLFLNLVADLVALESANNKATLYVPMAVDTITPVQDRGVRYFDINFGGVYPHDGTAFGRTPASTFKVVYSTSS